LPNLLERGFETFSAMEGIADFVTTIVAREARLSQALLLATTDCLTIRPLPWGAGDFCPAFRDVA
jgi:hypothetical protein